MYSMSEYLMISHELERARWADRTRKENLPPAGSPQPTTDRRVCQTNRKEVTTWSGCGLQIHIPYFAPSGDIASYYRSCVSSSAYSKRRP